MNNKELDQGLAENVKGWHYSTNYGFSWVNEKEEFQAYVYTGKKDDEILGSPSWHPTENIKQVYELEEMIPEDKQEYYIDELRKILDIQEKRYGYSETDIFQILGAKPDQRCQAIYKAITGGKND